jgi:hypothetical protein
VISQIEISDLPSVESVAFLKLFITYFFSDC